MRFLMCPFNLSAESKLPDAAHQNLRHAERLLFARTFHFPFIGIVGGFRALKTAALLLGIWVSHALGALHVLARGVDLFGRAAA